MRKVVHLKKMIPNFEGTDKYQIARDLVREFLMHRHIELCFINIQIRQKLNCNITRIPKLEYFYQH